MSLYVFTSLSVCSRLGPGHQHLLAGRLQHLLNGVSGFPLASSYPDFPSQTAWSVKNINEGMPLFCLNILVASHWSLHKIWASCHGPLGSCMIKVLPLSPTSSVNPSTLPLTITVPVSGQPFAYLEAFPQAVPISQSILPRTQPGWLSLTPLFCSVLAPGADLSQSCS